MEQAKKKTKTEASPKATDAPPPPKVIENAAPLATVAPIIPLKSESGEAVLPEGVSRLKDCFLGPVTLRTDANLKGGLLAEQGKLRGGQSAPSTNDTLARSSLPSWWSSQVDLEARRESG